MKNRLVLAAVVALVVLHQRPASAQASFSITSGQTSTTAQTLGPGQTGAVAKTGTLNISSSKNAIAVLGTTGSTGTATITNSGLIEQTGTARAIRDTGSDVGMNIVVTNNAGATIKAVADDAIEIQFPDDSVLFNNSGTVSATGSGNQPINFTHIASASNVLNNYSTGVIQCAAADAVRPGVNGFVNNDGLIKVTTPAGDVSSSDGIDAQANTGVTITNAFVSGDTGSGPGLIEGERHGITGGNTSATANAQGLIGVFTMNITNAANYTIQGDNGSGINIDGVGVSASGAYDVSNTDPDVTTNEMVIVNNAGTIIGNGVSGDGDAVDVDGLVQLTNSGIIRSQCAFGDTSEGVTVGGGTITNRAGGVIEGDNTAGKYGCNPTSTSGTLAVTVTGTGRGITLSGVDHDVNNNDAPIFPNQPIYGYSTIDNFGTVYGDTDSGIAVTSAPSQYVVTIINEAGATVEGAGQTQAAVSTGLNQAVVINAGTITADNSGVAIDLGAGDGIHTDTLQILGGSAHVNGNITSTAGSASTLSIMPNASVTYTPNAAYSYNAPTGTVTTAVNASGNRFTYAGVISNLTSVEFGSGTTVLTATSLNTYTGNTTVDSAATLQLDGSIASAQTIVTGALQGTGSASTSASVEIQNGGDIYPGDSAGDIATLNVGALTLDSGATASFDLGSTSGSNDAIQSSGAATISSAANLAINLPANPVAGSYVLLTGASLSGTFQAPTFSPALPASLTATVLYSATSVTLQLQAVSSVLLQSSQNSAPLGVNVVFTATVIGDAPAGTVTFFDGTTPLGSVATRGATAVLALSNLTVGIHGITASYGGDSNNTSSVSSALQQEIDAAATSVALASSLNAPSYGQTVTFIATVTGQSPTGTVTFSDSSTTLCAAATITAGVASCTTSTLSGGAHTIRAAYNGDSNNLDSISSGFAQTVQKASSTTTLSTVCENTFVENQPFTLNAIVTGTNPSGTVTFNNGNNVLCSNAAINAGSASCTTNTLAVIGSDTEESYTLTANYNGDGNYAVSTSTLLSITVLSSGDVVFRNNLEADSASCPIE